VNNQMTTMSKPPMIRLASTLLGLATIGVFLISGPTVAHASPLGCVPESGVNIYGSPHNVAAETSAYSKWVIGPGEASYNESSTSTVGTTISASFEVDLGFLIASAKATFGVQISASVAHTSAWQYQFPVASGHVARVMVWHEAFGILVGNWSVANSCVYHWTNLSWMYVPYASTNNSYYEVGAEAYPGATIKSWP
jgi:hypothetical protein